ncbi:MAG: hypothetical protein AAGD96_23935, partial [Chloroflexota bacterium]
PNLLFDEPTITQNSISGSMLSISWDGCQGASGYRVIYGPSNQRPETLEASTRSAELSNLPTGDVSVIVECSDNLGNSVYSAPFIAEVR